MYLCVMNENRFNADQLYETVLLKHKSNISEVDKIKLKKACHRSISENPTADNATLIKIAEFYLFLIQGDPTTSV